MKRDLVHPISKVLFPVVLGMCSHPDDLKVWEKDHGAALELQFSPHMGDIKFIIGKGGRQAKAIQFVGHTMGHLMGISVDIQIEESFVGDPQEVRQLGFNPNLSMSEVEKTLQPVLAMAYGRQVGIEQTISNSKFVFLMDVTKDEVPITAAINDMFYPYGKAKGRKIEIKPRDKSLRPIPAEPSNGQI